MKTTFLSFCIFLFLFISPAYSITVSSKNFTESYILAEIFSKKIKNNFPEHDIKRNLGMGGTGILFGALVNGDIDFYPEYTGTIAEAILKRPELKDIFEINKALLPLGLTVSKPLGFNNSYAFAVKKETAEKYSINTISDLVNFPDLRYGFSYEFLERNDGYYALAERYGLKNKNVNGMAHGLAYEALESGSLDLIDVYSTDAKIKKFDLWILEDDLEFFPRYEAVILANINFVRKYPELWSQLRSLEGKINGPEMVKLNALVELEGYTFEDSAASFFQPLFSAVKERKINFGQIWKKTREHLFLVFISLLFAVFIGVPLGYLATCSGWLRHSIFAVSGIVQTIPSLALLCFFVPIMGIGLAPTLAALFLYSLLPIVRNACIGLESIDRKLKETSQVLGLKRMQSIFWIEIPLSMPSILAGIKTAAVINVGTATLAAFIGCGGLGSFIVTGLALNDINTILHGAVPAAILALILQYLFDVADRFLIPKGIRS